jgi:hypothetical protein
MPDRTAGGQRPTIWRYDGQWSKIPEPYEWDGTSDFNEALERAGFRSSRFLGYPSLPAVEIREHERDERWIVSWSPCGSVVHNIEVHGLPNFVTLFSSLAPAATADLLSAITEELSDLMSAAVEDASHEWRSRHPLPPRSKRS